MHGMVVVDMNNIWGFMGFGFKVVVMKHALGLFRVLNKVESGFGRGLH
jgi:hypothetical protein